MVKEIIIPYFPRGLKYMTPLIVGGAIYFFFIGIYWPGVTGLLLTVIILTTRYVTIIDLERKVCRDYLSFLGLALQDDTESFTQLEKLVITKGRHSRTINTRYNTHTQDWHEYTGTLIMDGTKKFVLLTRTNRKELLSELKAYSLFLQVMIEDRTGPEPFWVDTGKIG